MTDLRELQLKYEQEHDEAFAAAKLEELRRSAKEGDLQLPKATALIIRLHTEVQAHIDAEVAVKTRGIGGKFKAWLRALPSDVAALIAVRECIHMCTDERRKSAVTIQALASQIGQLYETEVRVREAEKVNPLYMKKIHNQLRDHNTKATHHIRRVFDTAYERIMKGEFDSSLSNSECIHIGKYGVQACMNAGLIELHRTTARNGVLVYVDLNPEIKEFLHRYSSADVRHVIDREASAMLCPPDPWTSLRDGGYLTDRRKFAAPLLSLKTIRPQHRKQMLEDFTAEKMPNVFGVANYLQSHAFGLHKATHDAMMRVWQAGGGIMGIPRKEPPAKPDFPYGEDWDKDTATAVELQVFSQWKAECRKYYEAISTWRGRVRELSGFLRAIQKGHDTLYFPVYVDKRGRWYYRGTPNLQGSDLAKAVLHFKERKPLGKRGLFWLKVCVANHFGYDKERFAARAKWTEQNWEAIERALDAPEDYPDVWGTDSPWCMFSAAYELREALRSPNPEGYCTGVIGHMDATCSGLQHFSAMLRDPVGAMYVNLTDPMQAGPKQDIYAKVAATALQAIKLDTEDSDPEVRGMALWWLQTGIPRGMAKKPVMTYVYSATLRGVAEFIEAYVEDEMPGVMWPDQTKSRQYSTYAARKLFQGIAATVPAADAAMHWLREVAGSMPSGKPMQWTTPLGFKVQHDYRKYETNDVWLKSCGVKVISAREYTDDTNRLQMQNAISPNFVHSMDATHLGLTALRMRDSSLSMVGIHDSFGTHMCDIDALHEHTRAAFVSMYYRTNPLGEFLWDVAGVGEPPMRGDFNILDVKDSEFFFC